MTILPLTYLGSTAYYARLSTEDCVIDVHENWVKQTARNRCGIVTANGPAALTVPVHGYGEKILIKDIRIDNSKRWQHQHWTSLVSSYRNSPFFEHYAERFEPFYRREFRFLLDFNLGLTQTILETLGMGGVACTDTDGAGSMKSEFGLRAETEIRIRTETRGGALKLSGAYIEAAPGDIDLRGKKDLRPETETLVLPRYTQVFEERHGFVPCMSVIDLLFCESAGYAARLLKDCSYRH